MVNVFISYRSTDIAQAEKLAKEVRQAGHNVWLDEWEINLGDSIIEHINEGLEGAKYVVLCYSSSGVMTPWMGREWMSTLARQLNSQQVKILPIVLTGGSPPAILADIKYIDFTDDWKHGLEKLLVALR